MSRPVAVDTATAIRAGSGAFDGADAPSAGRSAAGRLPLRVATIGLAAIEAAWLSVIPVTENSSIAVSETAALTQCQLCNCLSHQPRHFRRGLGRAGAVTGLDRGA